MRCQPIKSCTKCQNNRNGVSLRNHESNQIWNAFFLSIDDLFSISFLFFYHCHQFSPILVHFHPALSICSHFHPLDFRGPLAAKAWTGSSGDDHSRRCKYLAFAPSKLRGELFKTKIVSDAGSRMTFYTFRFHIIFRTTSYHLDQWVFSLTRVTSVMSYKRSITQ